MVFQHTPWMRSEEKRQWERERERERDRAIANERNGWTQINDICAWAISWCVYSALIFFSCCLFCSVRVSHCGLARSLSRARASMYQCRLNSCLRQCLTKDLMWYIFHMILLVLCAVVEFCVFDPSMNCILTPILRAHFSSKRSLCEFNISPNHLTGFMRLLSERSCATQRERASVYSIDDYTMNILSFEIILNCTTNVVSTFQ